jgi:RNA polymerase sigma-70 factor (family 1)
MIYINQTDEELALLLTRGDPNAFEVIYNRYAADLFRYARKNIALKEDCEEIVQEVFVSLWERHESLHVLSLKYYLLKAVRYRVIRYMQHQKVKKKYAAHFTLFEALYESIEHEQQTPEAIQTRMQHIIDELPERCKVAIKLRLLENLSNGEIAAQMNITKKTVEVYMLRAFTLFRSAYHKIYST